MVTFADNRRVLRLGQDRRAPDAARSARMDRYLRIEGRICLIVGAYPVSPSTHYSEPAWRLPVEVNEDGLERPGQLIGDRRFPALGESNNEELGRDKRCRVTQHAELSELTRMLPRLSIPSSCQMMTSRSLLLPCR
jgi:hypothetical protein